MMLTAYQVAKLITDTHSAKKIKLVRLESGEFRYKVKDLTATEYAHYADGEHAEEAVKESASKWVLLDAFSASGVKQVYEALSDKSKFDRVPMSKLVALVYRLK